MNADERTRRRRLAALARVDDDCRRTIPELRQPVDTAALVAASIRRYQSGGRPFDQEADD